jgi:hypothetical protein
MEVGSKNGQRTERILFETERHLVIGDVTLPPDGYQSRFSDAINREDVSFIPLLDVEIRPLDGGEAARREFVILAKAHIRMAHPVEQAD